MGVCLLVCACVLAVDCGFVVVVCVFFLGGG